MFFTHNGCLTNRWFPAKSHGALTKDDYAKMKTLAPMAPYADKLLMVRGIRAMNEWSFEGTLGQTNDPHTQVCGSFLTCHPVTPNNTGTAGASNVGKFDCKPTGRSLDHVCAEQLNPAGVSPLFVQLGGVSGSSNNTMSVISWDQPGSIFPGFGSPMPIFTSLTGLFTTRPITPGDFQALRRKTVIDCVRDDLNRLLGINMSLSDKKKRARRPRAAGEQRVDRSPRGSTIGLETRSCCATSSQVRNNENVSFTVAGGHSQPMVACDTVRRPKPASTSVARPYTPIVRSHECICPREAEVFL